MKSNNHNHNKVNDEVAGLALIREQTSLSHKSLPDSPTRKIRDERAYPTLLHGEPLPSDSHELSRELNIEG